MSPRREGGVNVAVLLALPLLLLLLLPIVRGAGIQCYRCTYKSISARRNRTDPIFPCASFDGHSKYVVTCPKSTMCEMKTFILDLPNGETITTTTRDCAHQSVTYRRFTPSKGWHEVTDIFEDAHAEGCQLVEHTDGIKVTRTEHCFCSDDRCNGRLRYELTGGADAVRWSAAAAAVSALLLLAAR
ncbi:uncharacterized protein LOC122384088 [Amphibalanus amphitrite]|nr:uncharacterized protein LOC122384088 [Amphibalanus amphitrite]